jgi:hypothetical protein
MSVTGRRIKIIGPECLGFQARLLSRLVTAVYDDALAEIGLRVSQFSLLNAVARVDDIERLKLNRVLHQRVVVPTRLILLQWLW